MKKFANRIFRGKDSKITLLLIFSLFIFVGLSCKRGSKTNTKPIPQAFLGDWEGQDGATLSIRADGTGDYHAGSTKVDGGTAEVNEAERTLSVTFFGIGKTMKIDQPPSGDQMKLDGVTFRRKGGFTTSTSTSDSTSNSKSDSPFSSDTPPLSKTTPSSRGDAPPDSEVESLVKETMTDFADAIEKEDFSDFRTTTSKDFQVSYTAAQLKASFQTFVDKKDQVLPSLNAVDESSVSFTDGPRIRTEKGYKILVANGIFSTRPYPVQFETEYELEKGAWKILKIKVKM